MMNYDSFAMINDFDKIHQLAHVANSDTSMVTVKLNQR